MIYERKKKINNMINKIKDKNILKKIFLLAHSELNLDGDAKYTCNNNGIYFDLNLLSDKILIEIENILITSNINENNTESDTIKYNLYSTDDINEFDKISNGSKLSNKEKNLITCYQNDK